MNQARYIELERGNDKDGPEEWALGYTKCKVSVGWLFWGVEIF